MISSLRSTALRLRQATLTPSQYALVAYVAMGAFTLIVMSGAAVRLTGSGLGCPRWPRCYGKVYPPLETHALIEFSNRMVTIPVTVAAFAAFLLSFRLRPRRSELTRLSALLPLGVLGQAVLGGLTVRGELAYGWVMGHFALSMLVLAAAVTLAWRASHDPASQDPDAASQGSTANEATSQNHDARDAASHGPPAPARERRLRWAMRACLLLGGLTIFVGTAATAAGPHAGGTPGQHISRLRIDGKGTMDFVIHRHGEIALTFGVLALLVWWMARRSPDALVRRATTALCALIALQGLVGLDQYKTHLPTELVWVHVTLAALTWVTLLWSAFASGALSRGRSQVGARERPARPTPGAVPASEGQVSSISLRNASEGSTLAPAARTRSASQLSDVTTLTEPG